MPGARAPSGGHVSVEATPQALDSRAESAHPMHDVLQHRPAWYVLGPLLGLVVLGLLVTINERFGVLGGVSNAVGRGTRRSPVLGWKGWLLVGVLGGSLAFRLLAGDGAVPDGYGWLTR